MIERDAKNLGEYVERMRDLYYKDQNEFPAQNDSTHAGTRTEATVPAPEPQSKMTSAGFFPNLQFFYAHETLYYYKDYTAL